MQQLFNISDRFSESLDRVRGSDRKRHHYFRQAQAWVRPSGARRGLVLTIGIGSAGLLLGVIGFILMRNFDQTRVREEFPDLQTPVLPKLAG